MSIDSLYNMSDISLFALIFGISLLFSIPAVWAMDRFIPNSHRYKENQGIGYISATICVIFAVLAGFAALYVLNNFNQADRAAQTEADEAMAVYHHAEWVQEPTRTEIQRLVKNYFLAVIHHDWPLMAKGEDVGNKTEEVINQMNATLHQHNETNSQEETYFRHQILKNIIQLRDAHAERMRTYLLVLRPHIWIVIVLGGFLTIAVNYFFGMNPALHYILTIFVSLIVSSVVFLLVALDHPFQGNFSVSSEAFEDYLILLPSNL